MRPVLGRGVRYRWDEIRHQHQLLFPEGILVLNETGAAIVQLCDGQSLEQIKHELAKSFKNAHLEEDVDEFLDRLATRGLLHDDNNDTNA
ncbi:MAG: pyrroloquinoline quinone biosynthesis peptide chaperone PqqD [Planctomycetes bacterium]|nr:pyrroloquinoline quinone biosynthesis peptide chaperone PqqD [Planctomycetota bacterium]